MPVIGYSDSDFHLPKVEFISVYEELIKNNILSNNEEKITNLINDFFLKKDYWPSEKKNKSIKLFLDKIGYEQDNYDISKLNLELIGAITLILKKLITKFFLKLIQIL